MRIYRTSTITQIFDSFRNPDKETVLTPWRVVNMHMSDCIGGFDFFDTTHTERQYEPRFVDHGAVTNRIFMSDKGKILELNSKSGLYPLYMAYSMWRERCREWERQGFFEVSKMTLEEEQLAWDDVIQNNIFVICKTPMAVSITRRTLCGFRNVKTINARYYPELIETLKSNPDKFIEDIALRPRRFWGNNKLENNMKFNAIVGNPPYQEIKAKESNSTNSAFASAVYPVFIDIALKLNAQYISMVTPSRWLSKQGQGIADEWVEKMLKSNTFMKMVDFQKETDCFPNVEIKGGVNYFLLSPEYSGKCDYKLYRGNDVISNYDNLDSLGAGLVIRDANAIKIISRIRIAEGDYYRNKTFADYVGPFHFYDKNGQLSSNWTGYSKNKDKEHNIKFYVNKQLESEGYGWIKYSDIPKNKHTINVHKVYLSAAYNGGDNFPHQIIGRPFYGEPGSVCSQTYNCIGYEYNLTKDMCLNIISYMQTKFFRYLVSIKKKTQGATSSVFQFVPLQDFSESWSDEKLYKKYNLSQDEIAYIESLIKPME